MSKKQVHNLQVILSIAFQPNGSPSATMWSTCNIWLQAISVCDLCLCKL